MLSSSPTLSVPEENDVLTQARRTLTNQNAFWRAMSSILFMKAYALAQRDRVHKIQAAEDKYLAALTTSSRNSSMSDAVRAATQQTIPVASQATGSSMGFTLGTSLHKVLGGIEGILEDAKFQTTMEAVLTAFKMQPSARVMENLIKEVEDLRAANAQLRGEKTPASTATVSTMLASTLSVAPSVAPSAVSSAPAAMPAVLSAAIPAATTTTQQQQPTAANDTPTDVTSVKGTAPSAILSMYGKTPTIATKATTTSRMKTPADEKAEYQEKISLFLSQQCFAAVEIAIRKHAEYKNTTGKTVTGAANVALLPRLEAMIFHLFKDHFSFPRQGTVAILNQYSDLTNQVEELRKLVANTSLSDVKPPVAEVKGDLCVGRNNTPCIDIVHKGFLRGLFLPQNMDFAIQIVKFVDPRRYPSALKKAQQMDPNFKPTELQLNRSRANSIAVTDGELPGSRVMTPVNTPLAAESPVAGASSGAMPPPVPRVGSSRPR